MKPAASHAQSLLTVLIGSLGQIVVQFALQVVLAQKFGSGPETDAYQAAFTLPTVLAAMIAVPLGIAFVPTMQQLQANGDRRADTMLSSLTLSVLLSCIFLAGLGTLSSDWLMRVLYPGRSPAQVDAAAALFRLLIWSLPLNVLVGLFQTALHTRLNFGIPAVAAVLGPAITVGLTWARADDWGIAALAWGILAGSLFSVLIQGAALFSRQQFVVGRDIWQNLRLIAVVALPATLNMAILKIDPLVDGYVLASPEVGSLAHWGYAVRFVNMFILVSSGVLSTVAFPRLARSAAQGTDALVNEVRNALRLFLWVSLPVLAVMLLFGEALIRDLLERGKFTSADTHTVAQLMAILSGMVFAAGLGEICGKIFYARLDTRTPLVITIIAMVCMAVAKLALVKPADAQTLFRINSIVYVVSASVQLALVSRALSPEIFRGLGVPLLRCLLATAVTILWGWLVAQLGLPVPGLSGLLTGTLVYFGCLWLSGELTALPATTNLRN